jgi:hypothetical protein
MWIDRRGQTDTANRNVRLEGSEKKDGRKKQSAISGYKRPRATEDGGSLICCWEPCAEGEAPVSLLQHLAAMSN